MTADCDHQSGWRLIAIIVSQGRFGQLTYMRIYQGRITRGDTIFSMADMSKVIAAR